MPRRGWKPGSGSPGRHRVMSVSEGHVLRDRNQASWGAGGSCHGAGTQQVLGKPAGCGRRVWHQTNPEGCRATSVSGGRPSTTTRSEDAPRGRSPAVADRARSGLRTDRQTDSIAPRRGRRPRAGLTPGRVLQQMPGKGPKGQPPGPRASPLLALGRRMRLPGGGQAGPRQQGPTPRAPQRVLCDRGVCARHVGVHRLPTETHDLPEPSAV